MKRRKQSNGGWKGILLYPKICQDILYCIRIFQNIVHKWINHYSSTYDWRDMHVWCLALGQMVQLWTVDWYNNGNMCITNATSLFSRAAAVIALALSGLVIIAWGWIHLRSTSNNWFWLVKIYYFRAKRNFIIRLMHWPFIMRTNLS